MDFSTFSVPLMTALAIAAGTDYAIFLIGRYHEARQNGEDPESAYYTAFHGVGHVILGSGLTIAGAMLTLRLTRLSYFNSLAYPSAMALIIVVAAALTVAPAILVVGSRFGLLDPKRMMKTRGWRKVGTATVRWPKPILAAATSVVLLGMLAMIGYKTSYDDRRYIPADVPANVGYAAAEKHFSTARLNPDIMTIESDHDMRNPTDMIVLDRIAKALFRIEGIAMVQSITRPLGSPIAHSSIPYQVSMSSVPITQNLQFLKQRVGDISTMSDDMGAMIASMTQMQALMVKFSDAMHTTVGSANGMVDSAHRSVADMNTMKATLDQMRDHIADFDDAVRPLRNYFYWDPNCFNIPACWGVRSAFDAMDGVNTFSDNMASLQTDMTAMVDGMDKMVNGMGDIDALAPQMVEQFAPIIATATTMQNTLQTIHSSFDGLIDADAADDRHRHRDGRSLRRLQERRLLLPSAGSVRQPRLPEGSQAVPVTGRQGRPADHHPRRESLPPRRASRSSTIELTAAHEAVKGTALAGADIYLAGTAATYRDIQSGAKYDTMIAAFAALTLIFIVMLIITRALVASMVIVGTVVISLGAAFGLSVFIFERIVGIELNWIVLAFAVIILMAVGSDYNLLLVSRFKEEIGAGINTGIIRSMGSTGTVVTAAGLVFAFTMGSMISGDLLNVGQGGMTIGIGLVARHPDRAIADDTVDRGHPRSVVLVAAENPPAPRLQRAHALGSAQAGERRARKRRQGHRGAGPGLTVPRFGRGEFLLPLPEGLLGAAAAPVAGDRRPLGVHPAHLADVGPQVVHDGLGLAVDEDLHLPGQPLGGGDGLDQRGVVAGPVLADRIGAAAAVDPDELHAIGCGQGEFVFGSGHLDEGFADRVGRQRFQGSADRR